MSRRRGSIHLRDNKLYARLTWRRPNGKQGSKEKRVATKTEGWRLIDEWKRDIEKRGAVALDSQKMKFNTLADYVRDNYFIAPISRGGKRVSGISTWEDRRSILEMLRQHFGNKPLRAITWGDVERFKRERLNTPTRHGNERSIARVNRELSVLRRAFSVAHAEGWIERNPFQAGSKPLIEASHENKRERILSANEETRLLAACTGRRAHLRAILICALDTGMRQGEIFTLATSDVDLMARLISIRSTNTKTQQSRQVPIARRLLTELKPLLASREPDELVFGILDNVKNGFKAACAAAKIEGLRFHDLRHTAATRWIQAGIPVTTVSKLLGHSDIQTTMRYINPTPQMLTDVLAVFDSHPNSHNDAMENESPTSQ